MDNNKFSTISSYHGIVVVLSYVHDQLGWVYGSADPRLIISASYGWTPMPTPFKNGDYYRIVQKGCIGFSRHSDGIITSDFQRPAL